MERVLWRIHCHIPKRHASWWIFNNFNQQIQINRHNEQQKNIVDANKPDVNVQFIINDSSNCATCRAQMTLDLLRF